ncbi:MAG: response regulator [Rickettsiaceae bacterium]
MNKENVRQKDMILFVDDEKICHTLIDLVIPNFTKYKVLNAYNAEEAIALGKRYANDICLVLSDIMLPDSNGYSIYNMFSKDEKMNKIPFIFQSGLVSQELELRKNLIDKPVEIIYKPYKKSDLLAVISKVLGK